MTLRLLNTYFPDGLKKNTLIGKELWDFLSGEENYREKVLCNIIEGTKQILGDKSFMKRIKEKINALTIEFENKYGSGEKGIMKYINDQF